MKGTEENAHTTRIQKRFRQRITPLRVLYTGLILIGMLVIISLISLSVGPAKISLKDVLVWLTGYKSIDQTAWMILFKIRLPNLTGWPGWFHTLSWGSRIPGTPEESSRRTFYTWYLKWRRSWSYYRDFFWFWI